MELHLLTVAIVFAAVIFVLAVEMIVNGVLGKV